MQFLKLLDFSWLSLIAALSSLTVKCIDLAQKLHAVATLYEVWIISLPRYCVLINGKWQAVIWMKRPLKGLEALF